MSCNGNCCGCGNLFIPTNIDLGDGIYTITLAPDMLIPKECCDYCILLRIPIPTDTTCNRVIIDTGTEKYDVLTCNGNYWRPCMLKCRSILKLKYYGDPAHFVIQQVKR